MKKTIVIVDVSNLYYCVRQRFGPTNRLDYDQLLRFIGVNREIGAAIAYGAEIGDQARYFKAKLQHLGFETRFKEPKSFPDKQTGTVKRKADWDVGMAVDALARVNDFDVFVFVTADSDMAPCIDYLRDHGKECEVIGCGVARELKASATSFFEVGPDLLEGDPVEEVITLCS